MNSIFIQIPSYNDFELPKTVASAIHNCSNSSKLHFGIANCVLEDGLIERPICKSPHRISMRTDIAPDGIGIGESRYIANSFYDGERYYLQIDAHMRFKKNWDLGLIESVNEYINEGIEKPLVSMYPAAYWYDDSMNEVKDTNSTVTKIAFIEKFEDFKVLNFPHQTAIGSHYMCGYTPSVSGGSIFTVGDFALVKPNRKIAFWGEEMLIAARAFTSGFIPVIPKNAYLFHLYFDAAKTILQNKRNHAWQDFPELWSEMVNESNKEFLSIFENNIIGEFALGTERTLDEYFEFAGINFAERTVVTRSY
jgi:hypothetical protein